MADGPSPSDFDRVQARVEQGEKPYDAARLEGFTLSALKRADRQRHGEILAAGWDEQAAFAVNNLRVIGAETDNSGAVKANELLLREAGRLQERVTVSGDPENPLEVLSPDVSLAIERFTASVVQLAARNGARGATELAAGGGESGARVPVGRVASQA